MPTQLTIFEKQIKNRIRNFAWKRPKRLVAASTVSRISRRIAPGPMEETGRHGLRIRDGGMLGQTTSWLCGFRPSYFGKDGLRSAGTRSMTPGRLPTRNWGKYNTTHKSPLEDRLHRRV